jgi:hypothetical protein
MANDHRSFYCLVEGDSTAFKVMVPIRSDVSDLKKLVLEEGVGVSQGVLAKDLVLWKVCHFQRLAYKSQLTLDRQLSVPIPVDPDDTLSERIKLLGSNPAMFAIRLSAGNKIAPLFSQQPSEDDLHILVQKPPPSECEWLADFVVPILLTLPTLYSVAPGRQPSTPENKTNPLDDAILQHTPSKPGEEIDSVIDDFLEKHRPRMKALVENANHIPSLIPSWKLDDSADELLAKHVSELCIPTVSGGQPSLLLHDLGEERTGMDKQRAARIPHIFSFASHM